MHNMIIGCERDAPVFDDQPFDHKGPLAQFAEVLAKFVDFLVMYQEIRNGDIHNHLQDDLEHLWMLKGKAQ
jgi:hypothetical protein